MIIQRSLGDAGTGGDLGQGDIGELFGQKKLFRSGKNQFFTLSFLGAAIDSPPEIQKI